MGLILNIFVLLAIFESGLCLKCYVCNSQSNPRCVDPFKPGNDVVAMECSHDKTNSATQQLAQVFTDYNQYTAVMTPGTNYQLPLLCQKLIVMKNGMKVTARGCEISTTNEKAVCDDLKKKIGGDVQSCEICNSDGCNGSTAVAAPAIMALAGLAALITYASR